MCIGSLTLPYNKFDDTLIGKEQKLWFKTYCVLAKCIYVFVMFLLDLLWLCCKIAEHISVILNTVS